MVAAVSALLAASEVTTAVGSATGPDVSSNVLLQAGAGALALTVLTVVGGWAVIELARGSGLVVALGLVAVVVVEFAVRIVAPLWVPWLPSSNVQALVHPGGLTLELYENPGFVGTGTSVFEHIGQVRAATMLGVLTVVLALAAVAHQRARQARQHRARGGHSAGLPVTHGVPRPGWAPRRPGSRRARR